MIAELTVQRMNRVIGVLVEQVMGGLCGVRADVEGERGTGMMYGMGELVQMMHRMVRMSKLRGLIQLGAGHRSLSKVRYGRLIHGESV